MILYVTDMLIMHVTGVFDFACEMLLHQSGSYSEVRIGLLAMALGSPKERIVDGWHRLV